MGKVALVFPGQGAQYVGMAKDLYENNAVAKSAFFIVFLLKDCWVLRGFFALIFHNKQSKYGCDE